MIASKKLPARGSAGSWLLAARPKTLLAAVAPVLLGSGLAFADGQGNAGVAGLILLAALLLQIGANLVNDCADSVRGADGADRLGPPRATSSGLLTRSQVLAGAATSFLIAMFFGSILVLLAGWQIALLGVAAIVCAVIYTAGPLPLAYLGLGDLFAFLFFGPIATAGTTFVLTGELSGAALLVGCAPGCYAVVLLTINNLRDRKSDRRSGKRTLVVRFGSQFGRAEIVVCLLAPAALPWIVPGMPTISAGIVTAVAFVVALPVLLPVVRGIGGGRLNRLLGPAAVANLLYAAAFTGIWLVVSPGA